MKVTIDLTPHELAELSTVLEEHATTLRFRAEVLDQVADNLKTVQRRALDPEASR